MSKPTIVIGHPYTHIQISKSDDGRIFISHTTPVPDDSPAFSEEKQGRETKSYGASITLQRFLQELNITANDCVVALRPPSTNADAVREVFRSVGLDVMSKVPDVMSKVPDVVVLEIAHILKARLP